MISEKNSLIVADTRREAFPRACLSWPALLLSAFLILFPGQAHSCLFRIPPPAHPIGYYDAIFVGRIESIRWPPSRVLYLDITPPLDVEVRVLHVYKGSIGDVTWVTKTGGCGVPIPESGMYSVFFVRDGKSPTYEYFSNRAEAREYLENELEIAESK